MLCELRIRNLAIVEDLTMTPGPGLNVLSGETGAGKSILIEAIELLLGGKASSEMIRTGADQLRIDGRFQFDSDDFFRRRGLDLSLEDRTLLLVREVSRNGRSRILVNDEAATLGRLKAIGERLADLHGQHEHQSLLRVDTHVDTLDRLAALQRAPAGARETSLAPLDAYRLERGQWFELTKGRREIAGRQGNLEERRSRLEREIAEIRAAALRPDEAEELQHERQRLLHAGRLLDNVGLAADEILEGEAPLTARLAHALRHLGQASAIDGSLREAQEALEASLITLQEQGRFLASYREGLQFDPGRAEWIESRLALISRLRKSFGATEADILARGRAMEAELAGLADEGVLIARLDREIERVAAEVLRRGAELTAWRRAAAQRLEKAVQLELASLGMGRALFQVQIAPLAPEATPDSRLTTASDRGLDAVEFYLAANPGEEARPLARIASGGELSRVMLALKTVLRAVDPVPILLFDEVDAGIGGAVASAVGERLHELARLRQVFVITHLPMVASQADLHFRVEKVVRKGRTITEVRRLDGGDREAELARMLTGSAAGSEALDTARALLADSQKSERRKGPG